MAEPTLRLLDAATRPPKRAQPSRGLASRVMPRQLRAAAKARRCASWCVGRRAAVGAAFEQGQRGHSEKAVAAGLERAAPAPDRQAKLRQHEVPALARAPQQGNGDTPSAPCVDSCPPPTAWVRCTACMQGRGWGLALAATPTRSSNACRATPHSSWRCRLVHGRAPAPSACGCQAAQQIPSQARPSGGSKRRGRGRAPRARRHPRGRR